MRKTEIKGEKEREAATEREGQKDQKGKRIETHRYR